VRRGGRLVFQEIFADPGGDLLCPWHVIHELPGSTEHVRTLLCEAGFDERVRLPLTPGEPAPATVAAERTGVAATVVSGPAAVET
jgi:hypothetical protein